MKRRIKICFCGVQTHIKPLYMLVMLLLIFLNSYTLIKFLQKTSEIFLRAREDLLRTLSDQISTRYKYVYITNMDAANAREGELGINSGNVLAQNVRRKRLVTPQSDNKSILSSKIITNKKEVAGKFVDAMPTKTSLSRQQEPHNCSILHHHFFPLCVEKFAYIGLFWKKNRCFGEVHNVNGSRCSIYHYLTVVEPYCVGSRKLYEKQHTSVAVTKLDINGLLELLSSDAYAWMRGRISFLWSNWVLGANLFSTIRSRHRKKKVLVFLGSFAAQPLFFVMAGKGGPLGELIQWSDLITSLYILGYDITICKNLFELSEIMNIRKSDCALDGIAREIDVIYTDIRGVRTMFDYYGENTIAKYKCMLRVLDSFGTYPEFNFPHYPHNLPRGRSNWGNLNLITTQFLTLFPHTHDNHFLGFIMPNMTKRNSSKYNTKRNKALLYAKWSSYIKNHEVYLSVVSEYFEIDATCVLDAPLPPFIKNHGPVSAERIQELLLESKVFVGVGFPFEGPGPLEAMANGVVFLQPKFVKPVSKLNNDFFSGKPTLRKLKSQNPYMQEYIREPYCYTIDVNDEILLRKTLEEIKSMERLQPKIPKEFTSEGYLKRVHVFTEYLDYCNPYSPRWPPIDHLQIELSLAGESCKDACMSKGLMCERTYFNLINQVSIIERYAKLNCTDLRTRMVLHAPSVNFFTMTCHIQAHPRLFSCMNSREETIRICPCRDYETEESAICKNCL